MDTAKWPVRIRAGLLGAAAFWLPSVLLHLMRRQNFGGRDVLLLTVICSLAPWAVFIAKKNRTKKALGIITLSMVVGVWLSGGLFMMVGESFAGARFFTSGIHTAMYSVLISVVPLVTLELSTYDGTLFALLFITVTGLPIGLSGFFMSMGDNTPAVDHQGVNKQV